MTPPTPSEGQTTTRVSDAVMQEAGKVLKMTRDEAASELDRNEYRSEGSSDLFAAMKKDGLVAVFGGSDDLVELRGAIYDEVGASVFYVDRKGLVENRCDRGDRCPNWVARGHAIEPIFDRDGYTFVYETTIPHTTFEIIETDDDEETPDATKYCRGIVFSLADLAATPIT